MSFKLEEKTFIQVLSGTIDYANLEIVKEDPYTFSGLNLFKMQISSDSKSYRNYKRS
jgi:hypothetical protein